jgi:nicotinamide-nucleotide amidase
VFDPEILELAEAVLAACRDRGWHLATAEASTGGLVAAALTAIAGSSDVVERGFVTYSNEAKMELLGVPAETLAQHGAVSGRTAAAMARGAVVRAGESISPCRSSGSPALAAGRRKNRSASSMSAWRRAKAPAGSSAAFFPAIAAISLAALVEALEMLQAEAKPG